MISINIFTQIWTKKYPQLLVTTTFIHIAIILNTVLFEFFFAFGSWVKLVRLVEYDYIVFHFIYLYFRHRFPILPPQKKCILNQNIIFGIIAVKNRINTIKKRIKMISSWKTMIRIISNEFDKRKHFPILRYEIRITQNPE